MRHQDRVRLALNTVERGFAVFVMRDGVIIGIRPTEEGVEAGLCAEHGGHVRCRDCGAEHPHAGIIPKYSACPDCRKKGPLVDFIKRPSR